MENQNGNEAILKCSEVAEMSIKIAEYRTRLITVLCNEDIKLDCLVSPYELGETHVVRLINGVVVDEVGDSWALDELTLEDLIYIYEDLN